MLDLYLIYGGLLLLTVSQINIYMRLNPKKQKKKKKK